MTRELIHEPDAARYVLRDGGVIASVLDYRVLGDAVSFTRTFTNPTFRGGGLAAEVVEFAVDDVERTTRLRIVPSCWYVADWFAAHPERASLLQPRASEGP